MSFVEKLKKKNQIISTEVVKKIYEVFNIHKQEVEQTVSSLREEVAQKAERGEKGEKGDRGEKGEKGDDGKDGKDGIGIDGVDGKNGKDGKDGENGSPDTAEDIKKKLESLKGKDRLSINAIFGWENLTNGQKSGTIHRGGVSGVKSVSVSSDTNLQQHQNIALVDATAGEVVVTLPAVSLSKDREYHIKKIDSSANNVVIATLGSETIDGDNTITITNQYTSRRVYSNGANFYII